MLLKIWNCAKAHDYQEIHVPDEYTCIYEDNMVTDLENELFNVILDLLFIEIKRQTGWDTFSEQPERHIFLVEDVQGNELYVD